MCKKLIVEFYNKSNEMVEEKIASYPYNESTMIEQIFDLTYSDGKKEHLFDVFRPIKKRGELPAIIDIHGGGWYSCYKEMNKHFCMELAKEGFTVFSINYSLVPNVTIKEQIKEIFDFFNWLEVNAANMNVDLDKVFICGDSAGGHLASLATLVLGDNRRADFFGVKSNLKIAGATFICGAFDIKKMAKIPFTRFYFTPILGKGYIKKRILDEVDFFNSLSLTYPSTLLITSSEDFIKKQTFKAEKYLKSYNISTETLYVGKSNVPKRKLSHVFNVLYPTWEESISTNHAICEFFKNIAYSKQNQNAE